MLMNVNLLPRSALLNLPTLGLVARRGALAELQPHSLIQLINTTLQTILSKCRYLFLEVTAKTANG